MSAGPIWSCIHFDLKHIVCTREEIVNRAQHPTAKAGPGGTFCTLHAAAASTCLLAHTPCSEVELIPWFSVAPRLPLQSLMSAIGDSGSGIPEAQLDSLQEWNLVL